MERQNVTLSISKEVLKKAKHLAINRQKSLSGLLTETLEDLVERNDNYEAARLRQEELLKEGLDLGLYGRVSWSREELHER